MSEDHIVSFFQIVWVYEKWVLQHCLLGHIAQINSASSHHVISPDSANNDIHIMCCTKQINQQDRKKDDHQQPN